MNKILVDIAKQYLWVRETRVNNIANEIQVMQKATWLKAGAWPWCAAFCCHVLKKAIENQEFADHIHSKYNIVGTLENWRCKDASAFGWIAWAKKVQSMSKYKDVSMLFDEEVTAKAGDFVVFDFSHIGLVVDQVPNSGIITTIEGNTSPKTQQRDGVHDGVYQMTRKDTLVKSYIRL